MTTEERQSTVVLFNPAADELIKLAEWYRGLTINGIDDDIGYQMVREARKTLQSTRIQITKRGKEMRADAVARQKSIIAEEQKLVGIIEWTEEELKLKEETYKGMVEADKRRKILPERLEELAKIGVTLDEDTILSMDYDQFNKYILDQRQAILDAREAAIKAEEDAKIEAQRATQREAELEKARQDAAEKSRIETENRMRQEALDKEAADKKAKEDAEKKEKEDLKRVEQKKRYQAWLDTNNYDPLTHKVERDGETMVMREKKAIFNI